jgi:diguanylate cyclase (GGDEF)-like protein
MSCKNGWWIMTENQDLYRILQVHPDAEAEVIKSAYRKLCQKYHPDVNKSPLAHNKMHDINFAFEILGDVVRRAAYHKKWMTNFQHAESFKAQKKERLEIIQKELDQEAMNVLNLYFVNLSLNKFSEAYECISQQDKINISFEDFLRWQQAVSKLFIIGSFEINVFRRFDNAQLENNNYEKVLECCVNINEKNLKTNTFSRENVNKFIVYEKNKWKVFHGYGYIKPLIKKFEVLANAKAYTSAMEHWANQQLCMDQQTGLPNKQGMADKIQYEILRSQRYGSQFSIIYVETYKIVDMCDGHIKLSPDEEEYIKLLAMYIITKNIRKLDFIGIWEGSSFLIVLPETLLNGAKATAEKLINAFGEDENSISFGISVGVGTYKPFEDYQKLIDDAKCAARIGRLSHSKKVFVSPIMQGVSDDLHL